MNNFKQFLILNGLATITVRGHMKAVERIARRCGSLDISIEKAQEYVADLYTSPHSHSHKANQVKALEYWMEYTNKKITFKRQRKPKPLLRDTLSESEISRLAMSTKTPKERAIFLLLAYSGLRPKEICSVRVEHINFGNNQLRVEQGKGLRDRIVYLPGKCMEAIMQHRLQSPTDYLFYTYQEKQYSPQALRQLIKTLATRARIEKRVYPYLLRHSLATNMVKRGASILQVKEHLGHAWIETTMLYIHSIGMQERNEQSFPQYV